jgi:hypothetical protein
LAEKPEMAGPMVAEAFSNAMTNRKMEQLLKSTGSAELGAGVSKGAAKSSSGGGKSNTVEQDMRKTFSELGFTVVRTFGKEINKGSLHPKGLAIDLSIKKKSTEDLFQAAIVGINKGWQLVDERVPRTGKNGKIKQTGPHFHFEKDGGKDPSLFLGAEAYGGQAQLDYLKKLDADRLQGRPGIGDFQKEQNAEFEKGAALVKQYDDQVKTFRGSKTKNP